MWSIIFLKTLDPLLDCIKGTLKSSGSCPSSPKVFFALLYTLLSFWYLSRVILNPARNSNSSYEVKIPFIKRFFQFSLLILSELFLNNSIPKNSSLKVVPFIAYLSLSYIPSRRHLYRHRLRYLKTWRKVIQKFVRRQLNDQNQEQSLQVCTLKRQLVNK